MLGAFGASVSLTYQNSQSAAKQFPLGRIGLPDDVGSATCYLLSDMARFVTGTVHTVDGGVAMRG